VISIVQSQAAYDLDFLARERCEQVFDGKDVASELCRGIESGTEDLKGFYGLFLVDCEADCG